MKLGDYLKEQELSVGDFALKIGVKWPSIYRYMSGVRTPRKRIMLRILAVTGGEVTPNDIVSPPKIEKGK